MACSLKTGFSVSNSQMVSGFSSSRFKDPKVSSFPVLNTDFMGKSLVISDQNSAGNSNVKAPNHLTVKAQTSFCVSKAQRWWEKTLKPNMIEIQTPQALVDALVDAGDRLAIVDFYSPGCGGCKALHPKICQLAEMNPDAIFLKVNYEELKTMCHALHIHVLPFFRFYRGGEGRLCSFSCTNATIKKFKDALAKHGTDRCGIGPAKGLDETELERLAAAGLLSLSVNSSSPDLNEGTLLDIVMKDNNLSPSWTIAGNKMELMEENLMLKV